MIISYAETKSKAWNLRKRPGGGIFIFASLAEDKRQKTHPMGGFLEKPLYPW